MEALALTVSSITTSPVLPPALKRRMYSNDAILTVLLRCVGGGEAITNASLNSQGRRQLMPHTSADGMHLEWRVRVRRRYYPIVAKGLEAHLICYKDTAIPRHIEQISQFCPHRIAEFVKFLRDIHVIDQIPKH